MAVNEGRWRLSDGRYRKTRYLSGFSGLLWMFLDFQMVPKARLELARPFEHTPLKRACLPIPPLRQALYLY
jgi:hypothetical protein